MLPERAGLARARRLVFGVGDILSGTCTFIDKSGRWRVIDNPRFEGTRNPLEALVKVVVHGFSDVFTAQGLPAPRPQAVSSDGRCPMAAEVMSTPIHILETGVDIPGASPRPHRRAPAPTTRRARRVTPEQQVPNHHGTAPNPARLFPEVAFARPPRDPGAPIPMTLLRSVSRRHDQSYKLLFSIPLAVDQLIRHFLNADLAHQLDFERVEILATERIAAGLVRSHADLLWKTSERIAAGLSFRVPVGSRPLHVGTHPLLCCRHLPRHDRHQAAPPGAGRDICHPRSR